MVVAAGRMAADSFVLGVLGDFGGAPRDLDARRFLRVDRDNVDEIMGRLGVSLTAAVPSRLGAGELAVALRFGSPDEFHPDRIVAMVPALAALVKARGSLPSAEELERLGVEPTPRSVRSSDGAVTSRTKRSSSGSAGARRASPRGLP